MLLTIKTSQPVGGEIQPIQVDFDPEPDITAYELARILPLFVLGPSAQFIKLLDDISSDAELTRHLKIYR